MIVFLKEKVSNNKCHKAITMTKNHLAMDNGKRVNPNSPTSIFKLNRMVEQHPDGLLQFNDFLFLIMIFDNDCKPKQGEDHIGDSVLLLAVGMDHCKRYQPFLKTKHNYYVFPS